VNWLDTTAAYDRAFEELVQFFGDQADLHVPNSHLHHSFDPIGCRPILIMKKASILLCAAVCIFASVSCDKHSWKETQVLHEGMHKAHGEGHGDAHAKEAAHEEKKH
jgi:hypothetical protein